MPSPGRAFNDYKAVQGGSTEYTSVIVVEESTSSETKNGTLGQNDSLNMVFDNDVIIDDVTVLNPSAVSFSVTLVYATGNSIDLSGGNVTSFSINKPGDSSNIWYRIPRWSKIKISIANDSTDGILQVSAIGRS
jgi:hypothetical protein